MTQGGAARRTVLGAAVLAAGTGITGLTAGSAAAAEGGYGEGRGDGGYRDLPT